VRWVCRPRTVVAEVLLIAAVGLASLGAVDALATGHTYHVLKCHPSHPAADELDQIGENSSYTRVNDCGNSSADPKFGIYNDGAAGNSAFEQFMYVAPPSTVIRSACLQHKLRRQNHHRAEILAWPGFDVLASGGDGPDGWSDTQCYFLDHQQLIVRLACTEPGGCASGPNAHAYVRNVDIELEDTSDPVVTALSGSLFRSGWVRGEASAAVDSADAGSGASTTVLDVNGVELARREAECTGTGTLDWPYSAALIPCPAAIGQLSLAMNTAEAPFQSGANAVTSTAVDFAGNLVSESREVLIDNAKPTVAFANSQDPEDPELFRVAVADSHSGIYAAQLYYRRVGGVSWLPLDTRIEAGEARARTDSSSLPGGEYEFKAEASDVAGNETATTLRQNGTPMRLTFPLRFGALLETKLGPGGSEQQTVPYGTSSTVRGRLVDSSGDPLADQEVLVLEEFGDGALIRERPTFAYTDEDGQFMTKVPAGPSRRITVRFGGTQKYLPTHEVAGSFRVRSKASFQTSRDELKEGQRLLFEGKVAHHGARIPSGGKLIELQVRVKTGRWDTVREAFRTRANGRYSLGYRFGRHYVSDALFHFRVKVQGEGDWPFRGATSRQRIVVVHAR
jgi:hypothetical protein